MVDEPPVIQSLIYLEAGDCQPVAGQRPHIVVWMMTTHQNRVLVRVIDK